MSDFQPPSRFPEILPAADNWQHPALETPYPPPGHAHEPEAHHSLGDLPGFSRHAGPAATAHAPASYLGGPAAFEEELGPSGRDAFAGHRPRSDNHQPSLLDIIRPSAGLDNLRPATSRHDHRHAIGLPHRPAGWDNDPAEGNMHADPGLPSPSYDPEAPFNSRFDGESSVLATAGALVNRALLENAPEIRASPVMDESHAERSRSGASSIGPLSPGHSRRTTHSDSFPGPLLGRSLSIRTRAPPSPPSQDDPRYPAADLAESGTHEWGQADPSQGTGLLEPDNLADYSHFMAQRSMEHGGASSPHPETSTDEAGAHLALLAQATASSGGSRIEDLLNLDGTLRHESGPSSTGPPTADQHRVDGASAYAQRPQIGAQYSNDVQPRERQLDERSVGHDGEPALHSHVAQESSATGADEGGASAHANWASNQAAGDWDWPMNPADYLTRAPSIARRSTAGSDVGGTPPRPSSPSPLQDIHPYSEGPVLRAASAPLSRGASGDGLRASLDEQISGKIPPAISPWGQDEAGAAPDSNFHEARHDMAGQHVEHQKTLEPVADAHWGQHDTSHPGLPFQQGASTHADAEDASFAGLLQELQQDAHLHLNGQDVHGMAPAQIRSPSAGSGGPFVGTLRAGSLDDPPMSSAQAAVQIQAAEVARRASLGSQPVLLTAQHEPASRELNGGLSRGAGPAMFKHSTEDRQRMHDIASPNASGAAAALGSNVDYSLLHSGSAPFRSQDLDIARPDSASSFARVHHAGSSPNVEGGQDTEGAMTTGLPADDIMQKSAAHDMGHASGSHQHENAPANHASMPGQQQEQAAGSSPFSSPFEAHSGLEALNEINAWDYGSPPKGSKRRGPPSEEGSTMGVAGSTALSEDMAPAEIKKKSRGRSYHAKRSRSGSVEQPSDRSAGTPALPEDMPPREAPRGPFHQRSFQTPDRSSAAMPRSLYTPFSNRDPLRPQPVPIPPELDSELRGRASPFQSRCLDDDIRFSNVDEFVKGLEASQAPSHVPRTRHSAAPLPPNPSGSTGMATSAEAMQEAQPEFPDASVGRSGIGGSPAARNVTARDQFSQILEEAERSASGTLVHRPTGSAAILARLR